MDKFLVFEGENEIEFMKTFGTKDSCYEYLANCKWKDSFSYPYCDSNEEYSCQKKYYKRCKKCQRVVSPTVNTLFHRVKFGIEKAFYSVFKMSATTKSISAEQLSKSIGVNRKTTLLFQQKVRLSMQSSENYPKTGQVEVDEAFIGQMQEGKVGRGSEKKAQIVVAVEKNGATGASKEFMQGELKIQVLNS